MYVKQQSCEEKEAAALFSYLLAVGGKYSTAASVNYAFCSSSLSLKEER